MAGEYLIVRGGVYYFKRAVPTKLAGIIGRKLWRETLKATAPHLAGTISVYRAGYSPEVRGL